KKRFVTIQSRCRHETLSGSRCGDKRIDEVAPTSSRTRVRVEHSMTASRPTEPKVRRGKLKLRSVREASPKDAPWYASAASRIGIASRTPQDQRANDKSRPPAH